MIGLSVFSAELAAQAPAERRRLLVEAADAGLDHLHIGDHVTFHGGYGWDGLINATPIGMAGHPGLPISPALLRSAQWVAEVIYIPLETELLRTARAAGCRCLDGGGMAVFQAVEAFRLFTGLAGDPDRMLRHFAAMTPDSA